MPDPEGTCTLEPHELAAWIDMATSGDLARYLGPALPEGSTKADQRRTDAYHLELARRARRHQEAA